MNKSDELKDFFLKLLLQQTDEKATEWLQHQKKRIKEDPTDIKFFIAFSQASRYFKKIPLLVSSEELTKANELAEDFRPDSWNQLQTARVFLMLNFPITDASKWLKTFHKIFETADMYEQEALYAALPIMPFQSDMLDRAMEGLRTNISTVFDAVALNNPYPAKYFDERAWNQMVLKAVFMQRPLFQIQQADQRANPKLSDILVDFAHERWAAGRSVMPELWRYVGPFLKEKNISDIQKVLQSGDPLQEKAGLLVCKNSSLESFRNLPAQISSMKDTNGTGKVTWDQIGKEFQEANNA